MTRRHRFLRPSRGVAAMALHGGAAPIIGDCFRALGNAYQIANDILNFSGGDGAIPAVRPGRRAPNGVVVLFRQQLDEHAGANSTTGTPAVPAKAWRSWVDELALPARRRGGAADGKPSWRCHGLCRASANRTQRCHHAYTATASTGMSEICGLAEKRLTKQS